MECDLLIPRVEFVRLRSTGDELVQSAKFFNGKSWQLLLQAGAASFSALSLTGALISPAESEIGQRPLYGRVAARVVSAWCFVTYT